MENRFILIVDDNNNHSSMMKTVLESGGVTTDIIIAKNGVEALDYLFLMDTSVFKTGRMPSLILLDIEMPKIDGFQVLLTLRDITVTKEIPVVMVTSSSHPELREKAVKYGANGYIVKPFDIEELVIMTRRYLRN